MAAIEPAGDKPHFFLCTAYIPPTRASIPVIREGIAMLQRIFGTNQGIAHVPGIPRAPLVTAIPIIKLINQIKPRTPEIMSKIPAIVGLLVFSICYLHPLN